jgi:hypothetical protein
MSQHLHFFFLDTEFNGSTRGQFSENEVANAQKTPTTFLVTVGEGN